MLKKFLTISSAAIALISSLESGHFPNQIVVLGDSLSDSGNSIPVPDTPPAPPIRCIPITDGVPWDVILADKLGAHILLPSTQGGTNFAYAGAFTAISPTNPSLEAQLTEIPAILSRNTPVFTWGGANDIFFLSPSDPTAGPQAAINIATINQELRAEGFQTLIAFNLPNLGELPFAIALGPPASTLFTAETLAFNATLIEQIRANKVPVFIADVYSLFNSIIDNPAAYGFTHVTTAPNYLIQNTAGYAFWFDGVHPSEAGHRIIADYVFALITAPGCYASLADVPTGMLRGQRAVIHQQLYPVQLKPKASTLSVFTGGTYAPALFSPLSDFCNKKEAQGGNVTAGITYQVSDSWGVGAALSYLIDSYKCHESHNICKYTPQAGALSLFFDYAKPCYYLNGIFNFAWIDYGTITRQFFTGPVSHTAKGKTKGTDYDGELYSAYYVFLNSSFQTGPYASVNYQNIHVDGYRESGADIGNLIFQGQNNSILTTGLGWEARFNTQLPMMCLSTDVCLAANRQWLSKNDLIYYGEVSTPGVFGTWPIKRPTSNYISGEVNLTGTFRTGVTASIGYTFNVGSVKMSEHFLTASVNFPL